MGHTSAGACTNVATWLGVLLGIPIAIVAALVTWASMSLYEAGVGGHYVRMTIYPLYLILVPLGVGFTFSVTMAGLGVVSQVLITGRISQQWVWIPPMTVAHFVLLLLYIFSSNMTDAPGGSMHPPVIVWSLGTFAGILIAIFLSRCRNPGEGGKSRLRKATLAGMVPGMAIMGMIILFLILFSGELDMNRLEAPDMVVLFIFILWGAVAGGSAGILVSLALYGGWRQSPTDGHT